MSPVILLLIATIADISVTILGLGVGAFETNPLVTHAGWVFTLGWKLAATLFVAFVLHKMGKRLGKLAFIPGSVLAVIVVWNILNVLFQLRML